MKKILLAFMIAVLTGTVSIAQTAPNFTATDCDGSSYDLYTELASGKVIVLVWVMPCAACIGPSLTAYNIVQSYASPNVVYYLIDDAHNTSCTVLSNWATNTAGIGSNRVNFSTASIVESNYGGVGMPHVAVVGSNGTYYFNQLNSAAGNSSAIQNAIDAALAAVDIKDNNANTFSLSVFPNPSSENVKLTYSLKESITVSFDVLNETGGTVASYSLDKQNPGKHEFQFDVNQFANGNYFVRFKSGKQVQTMKFAVSH